MMDLDAAIANFIERTSGFAGFWCVAGGWAIDLFLGRQTRMHEDLEIVVLRRDWTTLYEQFQQFSPSKIISGEPPIFVPWQGEPIESDVIQIRLDPVGTTEFDLLLTPAEGNAWICRRDESIRRPLNQVCDRTSGGVPFLAPEVVLLFKAKYVREKDQRDFESTLGSMNMEAKCWLRNGLTAIHPGHIWIDQLL